MSSATLLPPKYKNTWLSIIWYSHQPSDYPLSDWKLLNLCFPFSVIMCLLFMFLILMLERFECVSLYQGPKLLKCDVLPWDILIIVYHYSLQNRKICWGSNSNPIFGLSSFYILMWTRNRQVDACRWHFLYLSSIILMLLLVIFLHTKILRLFTNFQRQTQIVVFADNILQPDKQATWQLLSSKCI